jgi:ATPase subunit of ABC transporter with duplicated ATPase domains
MITETFNQRVGIVGPCASGKTTLIKNLKLEGVELRHIAQEHSYVPYMWKVISKPRRLVYLDVSYEESLKRKSLNWTEAEYREQLRRLTHAREHADFYLMTDGLSPEQVAEKVKDFLNR